MGLRKEILELNCEISEVHCFLSKIPQMLRKDSWEKAIQSSIELFDTIPPKSVYVYQTGYFTQKYFVRFLNVTFRKMILLSKWLTNKKTRKTVLRNSLLRGNSRIIRKKFRKIDIFESDTQYLKIGILVAGFSILVGMYYVYDPLYKLILN